MKTFQMLTALIKYKFHQCLRRNTGGIKLQSVFVPWMDCFVSNIKKFTDFTIQNGKSIYFSIRRSSYDNGDLQQANLFPWKIVSFRRQAVCAIRCACGEILPKELSRAKVRAIIAFQQEVAMESKHSAHFAKNVNAKAPSNNKTKDNTHIKYTRIVMFISASQNIHCILIFYYYNTRIFVFSAQNEEGKEGCIGCHENGNERNRMSYAFEFLNFHRLTL